MAGHTAKGADVLPAELPYRSVEVLGRGATAVVHRAVHEVHGGEAAVKVYATGVGESVRRSFAAETSLQWQLSDHPNVVRLLHASAIDTSRPWIVMELYERSLEDVLRERARYPALALRGWGIGLVRGLAAVHREGRLHRDVKPSNVLVKGDISALSDFGCSLVMGQTSRQVAGTPRYLAPEVRAGAPASTRSDVFAAGITLQRLWQDVAPPAVAGLLDRAASYDPGDRPSDAVVLLAELEALLSAPPLAPVAPAPLPRPSRPPAGPAPAERSAGRGRGRTAIAVLAGTMVVALGSLVVVHGSGSFVSLPLWAVEKVSAAGAGRQDVAVPEHRESPSGAVPATTSTQASWSPTPSPTTPPPVSPTTRTPTQRPGRTTSSPSSSTTGRQRTSAAPTSPPGTSTRTTPAAVASPKAPAAPTTVELERYTPDREKELSTGQGGPRTTITFVDDSDRRIKIYFLHPAGRQFYTELDPGGSYSVLTTVKHAFLVADENDQGMFIVTAVDAPGQVTLT